MEEKGMLHKFGYSEMYEWANQNDLIAYNGNLFGLFVTFDNKKLDCIKPYNPTDATPIIGVSTICSAGVSDDPDEWFNKNLYNEYGDMYVRTEKLAVGEKKYDQEKEMSYIETRPWSHYVQIQNPNYDEKIQYVKRTSRKEWVRVNLMGKCIVQDNGTCKPGEFCMPYEGKIKRNYGTAVPATEDAKNKYYVIARFSDKTVLILNK